MNRRGFLGAFGKALAAVTVAPLLPMLPKPAPEPKLAFHPDAFKLAMASMPYRLDVLYGTATVRPNLTCRIIA